MTTDHIQEKVNEAEHWPAPPVQCLGRKAGICYYLTAGGEVAALRASEHKKEPIELLFDGDLSWPFRAFPRRDKTGQVVGYNQNELRAWLYQQSAKAGFFDPRRGVRPPGVWRNADGTLSLHCGDAVFHAGEWHKAGQKIDGVIYPASTPEPRPAKAAAGPTLGLELAGFLEQWAWLTPHIREQSLGSRIYLGFMGAAMICGALEWRPHILVTGDRGTGKSALNQLFEATLGESSIEKAAAPSAAGIRQQLNGAARPCMLDEVEHDADNNRAKYLVELARLASTEGQGAVVRGSVSGQAQAWHIRACFYFSAILRPNFPPQDASRIAVLPLGELATDPNAAARIREGIAFYADQGPALRARMVEGFGRFQDNLMIYRHAFAGAGADSREADQYGTLFAAYDTLTSDRPTDHALAAEIAAEVIVSPLVPDKADADREQCLGHLMTTPVELPRETGGRERRTVGEIAQEALSAPLDKRLRQVLGTYGIGTKIDDDGFWLLVANRHRGLDQIFHGTRWQAGVWPQALERFPGAKKGATAWIGGVACRATWLPADVLPPDPTADEEEKEPVDINSTE